MAVTKTAIQEVTNTTVSFYREKDTVVFGFWVYILTDCMLFASLFATYAVLNTNTFGGAGPKTLFNLQSALVETVVLLTSSFTSGLAMLAAQRNERKRVLIFLGVTFLLGFSFLVMEITEFSHLIQTGNSFQRSGFLSAFFTLVGTHGIHISVGLLWMVVLMIQVLHNGLTSATIRKLTCLSLFWHFLDIVWIFIFSIVYLMGIMS